MWNFVKQISLCSNFMFVFVFFFQIHAVILSSEKRKKKRHHSSFILLVRNALKTPKIHQLIIAVAGQPVIFSRRSSEWAICVKSKKATE